MSTTIQMLPTVCSNITWPPLVKDITFGLVRMYVTPYRFSWTIFILGLALSYTDTLLVFRWVQIVLL